VSYREILAGRGFPVSASRPAIEMVHAIRHAALKGLDADSHPFCRRVKA